MVDPQPPRNQRAHQQASKPKGLPPRIFYNCRQPGHYANKCLNPKQNKPHPQGRGSEANKGNHGKNPAIQVKQDQLDFIGNISNWSYFSLWLLILETRFFLRGVGCDALGF
jgi:hypothetical protein